MRRTIAGCAGLALLVACDDTLFGGSHGGETPAGTDYCAAQAVVADNCAGCHTGGGTLGELSLDDLHASTVDVASAVNGTPLVTPGSRDDSLLYRKVSDAQGGDEGGAMPPSPTGPMPDASIEVIGAWIDAGATTDCDEADADTDADSDTDTDTDADTDVSAWCGVEAILTSSTCTDCHCTGCTDGYSYLDLQTDTYANLVGQNSQQWAATPYVVPNYPEASLLYRKVDHTLNEGEGDTMPQFGDRLADEEVELIRSWIESGAADEVCE